MIADVLVDRLVRLTAPFVWRSRARMAAKLEGFAATEAGSALDMLKAAELVEDPALRRQFFRHALDEARHARMFRDASRRLLPEARHAASEYNLIHATRQNLLERYGLVGFIAFVHLAEKRGEAQFRSLAQHFHDHPELQPLFHTISREERFHVSYSGKHLERWRREGRAREVTLALMHIRFRRAWDAWRRSGRQIGDVVARALITLMVLFILPPFALLQQWTDRPSTGWQPAPQPPRTLDDARKES
ncbi:MAG: ferritin-like domain-containing protein [Myxococcota bacterium]